MSFPIPIFNKELSYFCHISGVFSKEEVERIIDLEDLSRFAKGAVGGALTNPNGQVNLQNRDSDVMWIGPNTGDNGEALWLFNKFADLTSKVNQDHFLYDIDHMLDFQYTVYREDQHYNWHLDSFNQWSYFERKISSSILLSDPEEYEGGEFEIIYNGNGDSPVSIKPALGDVLFFASWMPHRVRPVTKGVRKSLVSWVLGKRHG